MDSIRLWLEEYILTEKDVLGGEETDRRVGSMREMFTNHRSMSPAQFVEAMTTAHFTQYFSDALSRQFYADYQYQVGEWKNYTFPDTAPDFRDVSRIRMSEPGTLYKRYEKSEAKGTYITEAKYAYGVEEFSRQFDVSWQTILNDDLGKIKETPQRMARAAARFEDSFVSNLYDNATTQAALVALGAAYAGTGRLTAPNLAIAVNALMQRTDAGGNHIALNRVHLVIPPILRIQARVILESILMAGVATNDKNVLRDFIAGVHVDPYIATAAPNVPWYLFADPNSVPAVPVVRLQGINGPWVYKKRSDIEMITGTAPAAFSMGSFATGDIEYAVEDIIGGNDDRVTAGVVDVNGIYYSSGTTP